MRRTQIALVASLLLAFLCIFVFGPGVASSYLPVASLLSFDTARAVLEAPPEQIEPQIDVALSDWGFERIPQQTPMRERQEFYSCSGPLPTDDARLFGVYRGDYAGQPMFAEVRLAEVEEDHSFISIDFYVSFDQDRYRTRRDLRATEKVLAQYRASSEQWFAECGAAPPGIARCLQYSPEVPRGMGYVLVCGDHLKAMSQPMPEWLTAE